MSTILASAPAAPDADPLVASVLPAAAGALAHSTDKPSSAGVRPFGLTRLLPVSPENLDCLDGLHYDPVAQVSVTSAGVAVIDTDSLPTCGTTTDTRYDNQWVTDRD